MGGAYKDKKDIWNDCLLCSSLWGTCTAASSCKVKDAPDVDGRCVKCDSNHEAGCSVGSATTSQSACTNADARKAVTCASGYHRTVRYCGDDPNFCYVICEKTHHKNAFIIVSIAGGVVLLLVIFALLHR